MNGKVRKIDILGWMGAGFMVAVVVLVFSLVAIQTVEAKSKEVGCGDPFTKAGMWDVYDCYTPSGFHFVANSAGMLIPDNN